LSLSPKIEHVFVTTFNNKLFGDYYLKSMSYGLLDLLEAPLALTSAKLEDVVLTFALGTRISGRVMTEEGTPANLTVYLIPGSPNSQRKDMLRISATDLQGRFDLYGVAPGNYFLSSANDLEPERESLAIEVTGNPLSIEAVLGPKRGLQRAK